MKKASGFTLIELLVVISIIGVLMAIIIPSFNKFLLKSRDAKRLSDIKLIQSALEQYRSDQGFYPATLDLAVESTLSVGSKVYLQKTPVDPLNTYSGYQNLKYRYVARPSSPSACNNGSSNPKVYCTTYCIYAHLEDASAAESASNCAPNPENRNFATASP